MDCLEFRRRLGSDPRLSEDAARRHRDGCAACAAAQAHALAFEARLGDALAVPVPADLADRVLLAQLTGARQQLRRSRRRYAWLALAAAACLALALGLVGMPYRDASLPDLVVAHVMDGERAALQLRAPIAATSVEKAFADRGVRLASVPAGIAYVNECPIGRWRSVHMVMPEDHGAVSVIYVVQHRIAAGHTFQRDGFAGREVPLAQGTLVLLAHDAARFDTLEHLWRDALEGPPQVAAGSR